MSMEIKDGTGDCHRARVDEDKRLHVGSVSRTERDAAISDGRLFIMSTGLIDLADDAETPLIYVKNQSDRNLYLDLFISTTGQSTGGSGNIYLKSHVALDPTSTIITEAKPALVGNANTTSTKTFDGIVYKGETGDTFVNTINFATFIDQATNGINTPILAVLPKNGDICYTYKAPTGNTSMEVVILVTAYYLDEHLPN